jgi:hypothetical protein
MAQVMKDKSIGKGMVLTERDRTLVAAVAEFGILTREQIVRHMRFGSVTRANAVLLRLARHRYLLRRPQPSLRGSRRLTYTVGPLGGELLGLSVRAISRRRWTYLSDLFVEHQLAVNDVRLMFQHLEYPTYEFIKWVAERQLATMGLQLVPDGYCEYRLDGRSYAAFVEVDNGTESRSRWTQKTKAYTELAFAGRFTERFNRQFFRVLVTAPSARRRNGIAQEVARHTDRIVWLATHEELLAGGPFGRVWRRPADPNAQSLISTPR